MASPEDIDDTNARSRFNARLGYFRRKLFLGMIIALIIIVIFFVWYFFISGSNNVIDDSAIILPPNLPTPPSNP